MRNTLKIAAVIMAVTATSAAAQGRGRNTDGVPPGQRPPAGMCRVWINGVPPGQQPGVTDCATARAQVPANGRVLYGSGTHALRTYSRHRQLSDGSWVNERFTRDANGNIVIVSTKPWNKGEKQALKAHQKAEKRALKDRRDELDHDAMKDAREDLKDHQKAEKRESKGRSDNGGGKGKGKH